MLKGPLQSSLSMCLFEQKYFSLGASIKSMSLEHISDGLRVDRIRENIVDEFGGLNSIIELASGDLSYNNLLVTWSKLGRTAFSLSNSNSLPILPTVDFPKPVLAWIWHKEYPFLRRETTEAH